MRWIASDKKAIAQGHCVGINPAPPGSQQGARGPGLLAGKPTPCIARLLLLESELSYLGLLRNVTVLQQLESRPSGTELLAGREDGCAKRTWLRLWVQTPRTGWSSSFTAA